MHTPRPGTTGRPKVNGEQVNKKIETAEAVMENYKWFYFWFVFMGLEEEGVFQQ